MSSVDRIQIYLVEDDPALTSSLLELLEAQGYEGRGFSSTAQLQAALPGLVPGILLVDIRLGSENGIDVLRILAENRCPWPAAVITAHGDIPLAVEAVRNGAFDFVEKPFGLARLREVLATGRKLLSEAIECAEREGRARDLIASLSQRQRQVLDGIVEGLTSKEIALRHGLSHRTVEAYRADMMAKLQIQNSAELFQLVHNADGDRD